MKKRVLILEFRQETNTFNPIVTQLSDFNSGAARVGAEAFAASIRSKGAVCGAVDAFTQADIETIPSVFMAASSCGRVSDASLDYLLEQVDLVAKSNAFDGIYASLHGATCTETNDDACGTILEHLRKLAADKPIAASFDLHANITQKVLQNIDIICGYQTYPHRDLYEAGNRAGKLCAQMLQGKRFSMASAAVPMLVPPAGYTSDEGCFCQLMNWGKELTAQGAIVDFTVFPVQPWLDIPEIASRIIVIAQDDSNAIMYADQIAQRLAAMADYMQPQLLSVDEIIDIAENNESGKPVILSEFADSPNGGCVGDSVAVPLRLFERGSKLHTALFVRDPVAVEQAFRLGVGATGEFTVGAAFTPDIPGPLVAEGTVCSLHDGHFTLEGPANRGNKGYLGRSAVVRFGTVDILLCSRCSQSGDPQLFRHFGIEPSLYDLVVVKANTSFRLPYSRISPMIYCADTPGAGAANLQRFHWKKLPEGMYPFARDFAPVAAKIW